MTVRLIRNLSGNNIAAALSDQPPGKAGGQPHEPAAPRPNSDKPLLLQEDAHTADGRTLVPEFHTIRLDLTDEASDADTPRHWQADIERLEESARQAVAALTGGHADPGTPIKAAGAPQPDADPDRVFRTSRDNAPATASGDAEVRNTAEQRPPAEPTGSGPGSDRFSPRAVANTDIRPNDDPRDAGLPPTANEEAAGDDDGSPESGPMLLEAGSAVGTELAIRKNLDINRRAIERATSDGSNSRSHSNGAGHDYPAMEDKAIDRLLETTNALLETDDHTRKNQSLDRQKAAVLATEAERRIKVRTKSGTVTLDFDEQGGTRHPVADLLAAPETDPEKRKQRLQAYRKMISDHKGRS